MFRCDHHHQGAHYMILLKFPNGAIDIYQQGPDNICSHTTRLTTSMYLIDYFNKCNFSKVI